MVALLVSMAVSAVWMAALLPSWRQQVTREKEAELIFRGESIARAIYLYRQKNNQALPPSLDVLVSQRYLRQKYQDPITGKDFVPAGGMTVAPGGAGGRAGGVGGVGGFGGAGSPGAPGAASGLQGGIVGVRSTSNEQSIRIYNNQQVYSQWQFDFTLEQVRAGAGIGTGGGVGTGGPGGPAGGGRGGRGGTGTEVAPIGPGAPRGGGPGGGGRGPGGIGTAPGGGGFPQPPGGGPGR